ncbi:MAG: hypothetical protein U0792_25270 [Gemmataceae bacterium]
MAILWLFNTCGFIIAPLMWLAGLVAIGFCIRATRNAGSRNLAIKVSLAPLAVGIIGMIWGSVMVFTMAQVPNDTDAALSIGKVGLAGLVVTAIPLLWALSLRRPEPQPLPNIA